jgi:hypothetical protein
MRTAEGPFPMETTYAWEDVDGGTRMTLRNRGEPAGFSKVAAPVMAKAIRRANRKDLARLKAHLERSTPAEWGSLGHVDPHRRGFVSRLLRGGLVASRVGPSRESDRCDPLLVGLVALADRPNGGVGNAPPLRRSP